MYAEKVERDKVRGGARKWIEVDRMETVYGIGRQYLPTVENDGGHQDQLSQEWRLSFFD
jgi:hypothetical protein